MPAAEPRRRASDSRWSVRFWRWLPENFYRDIWLFGLTILLVLSLSAQSREARERRNETCIAFERTHRAEVAQLRQTYTYLLGLTAAQRREPLNRAVIAGLAGLERQVATSLPPRYCEAPGVGLPGPEPKIPKRPPGIL